MSIELQFTEADWERTRANWNAWWAGELERPRVVIQRQKVPEGVALPEAPGFITNLPLEMSAEEVIGRYQSRLVVTQYYGDAWPKWWPNFGPGIMAGFMGSAEHTS